MSADDDKISWLAQEAAVSAGRAVIEQWGASPDHVRYKGKSDIVTTADILSDDIVAACIKAKFPSHRILSEEDTGSHGVDYSGPLWVVDPIDGTANHARGHPYFGISVAFGS